MTQNNNEKKKIRVAISGGGLAGASLMHALLAHPHVDAHIFESGAAFREAGMAIGITRPALAALDLMGPSAAACLERAGAVPMRGVRFLVAQGPPDLDCTPGQVIDEVDYTTSGGQRLTSIVSRAAFLQELLATVPAARMHASKRLDKGDDDDDAAHGLTLHFTDGTTHECDILIGADGIHSSVRRLVLGPENAAACEPKNTGVWIAMTLQPYAEAQASMGKDLIDTEDAREHSWVGRGAFILHNLLSGGQLVQFVIAGRDREEDKASWADKWHKTVPVDDIREMFKDWPAHLTKAVEGLLCKEPSQPAIYLWEHDPPAPTYVSSSGKMAVMGDAAHATTPWQGSGGGMSIEDSMVLSALLGRASGPEEARAALRVYDRVRRPRTQRIVSSSRTTGAILTGTGRPQVNAEEDTAYYVKEPGTLLRRWDFILNLDVQGHRDEALRELASELGA